MASTKREASPEASPLKGPAPKAVPEDTSDDVVEDGIPLSPMAGEQTVQFISGTPANGDAKVEIGDSAPPPTFVGLGKEELMKYANDPSWVRLRWFLFILFWILWIAMLVGAVVIIVQAPRCAEKKLWKLGPAAEQSFLPITAETFYLMKAADLIKDGKVEEHVARLSGLGVETIVISEALQHEPDEPDAVTDFNELDGSIEKGLFENALEQLKKKGIKILLQIAPNHSGTKHEWFTGTETERYIRQPYEIVSKSVWVMQDTYRRSAWIRDPNNQKSAYLHQFSGCWCCRFSGSLADLNFGNPDVVADFKEILGKWKDNKVDGFLISKASFLVEDLNSLMTKNATCNQPENVKIISELIGFNATGPNLVELDDASNETINEYIQKGLTPIITLNNTSSPQRIREGLEDLNANPKVVINLNTQLKKVYRTPWRTRLISLLASAGGSHTILSHEDARFEPDNTAFLKSLLKFQKENPRGKQTNVTFLKSTLWDLVVVALRKEMDGDDYLIVANFGQRTNFVAPTAFNLTSDAKGIVVLATPRATNVSEFNGQITLNQVSGVVIKLEKKSEEVASE